MIISAAMPIRVSTMRGSGISKTISIISFTLVSSFDPLHILDLLKTSKTKLPLQYTFLIYCM
jgi:hypothetical protein